MHERVYFAPQKVCRETKSQPRKSSEPRSSVRNLCEPDEESEASPSPAAVLGESMKPGVSNQAIRVSDVPEEERTPASALEKSMELEVTAESDVQVRF